MAAAWLLLLTVLLPAAAAAGVLVDALGFLDPAGYI
jgi:hypothetical protein